MKSCSISSRDFEQSLIDHGIFPYTYYEGKSRRAQPAKNHVEIIQRLQQPQLLFSPPVLSRSEFLTVETALGKAKGETQVMSALAHVLKPDTRITSRADQLFTNLELLADSKLSQAKPDSYDGALPAGIHPEVRQELRQYIQPSKKATELLVPNFFLEGKAVNGDDVVLARQALYNGAFGARAMHHLRAFGLSNATHAYTREAETISVTYKQGGELRFYSIHYVESQRGSGTPECHMYFLAGYNITNSFEAYRAGATAYWNAREWAKERRDAAIARANRVVAERSHAAGSASWR